MVAFSQFLTRLVWPIQYAVNLPSQLFEAAQPLLSQHQDWAAANGELQREHIYLQAQVQKLKALEAENHELRELLSSVAHNKESFSEARLIRTDIDPFAQQILLNKGNVHGIEIGQPVIDAYGLVGLVTGVNQYTSRVLLITDPSFAVPVQSVRSGERAIAVGSGSGGELRLNYVPRTADFIEGDVLVTSGLGGRYPAGYPVGTITSIQHDTSTRFTLIGISPSAKLGQLRHVLFVKFQPEVEPQPSTLAQNAPSSTDLDAPIPKQKMVVPATIPSTVAQASVSPSAAATASTAVPAPAAVPPVSAPVAVPPPPPVPAPAAVVEEPKPSSEANEPKATEETEHPAAEPDPEDPPASTLAPEEPTPNPVSPAKEPRE